MITRRTLIILLSAALFLAGIVALWMALGAIRKGRVAMRSAHRIVQRDAEPIRFWISIVFHVLVAMFFFALGLTTIGVIPGGWLRGLRR